MFRAQINYLYFIDNRLMRILWWVIFKIAVWKGTLFFVAIFFILWTQIISLNICFFDVRPLRFMSFTFYHYMCWINKAFAIGMIFVKIGLYFIKQTVLYYQRVVWKHHIMKLTLIVWFEVLINIENSKCGHLYFWCLLSMAWHVNNSVVNATWCLKLEKVLFTLLADWYINGQKSPRSVPL